MSFLDKILDNLLDPKTLPGGLFYAVLFFAAALFAARLARIFAKRSARHFSDIIRPPGSLYPGQCDTPALGSTKMPRASLRYA